ncbi:MAG TPA: tetratricopeptide repeat protein [Chthoniobacterales bacterium]
MSKFNPDPSKPWRWIESDHWDLSFEGLPRRIPWFTEDPDPPLKSYGNANNDFPILRLYEAVETMLASEPSPPPDPRFAEFVARIDLGDDLVSAMESGDFIAAAGVLREMHRVSRPTGAMLMNEAYLAKRNGDEEGARELYRRATELCPEVEMLWRHYGEECEAAGLKDEAIRAYEQAVRILPNHQQAILGLHRLGERVRLETADEPGKVRFLTKVELRAFTEEEMEKHWADTFELRGIAHNASQVPCTHDLALRCMERVVELEPDDLENQRNLGALLRVAGRIGEAREHLERARELDPADASTYFHLAECAIDENDMKEAWHNLHEALDCNENHKPALTCVFLNRTDQTPEKNEADLLAYSLPQPEKHYPGSWQGHLLLANAAWKRDQRENAVRLAADAYKIAPEESEVFLTYTGMLAATGENEWVAALTKPRLRQGEDNPVAFMNFALALEAMGLRQEAIRVLREAVDSLDLTLEQRHAMVDRLDIWTGHFATCEIEIETQDGAGECLRRSIFQVKEGKAGLKIFDTGMGVGQHREIPVSFSSPKTEIDLHLEHRNFDGDPEQTSLGTFTVREIDPAQVEEQPVRLTFHLSDSAELGLAALQGQRKLPVSWGFAGPARHEPSEL